MTQGDHHQQNAVGIILLAAGSSSRMGQSKQLLPIGGETLLAHSIKASLASGVENIVVVLGSNEVVHRNIVQNFKVDIVYNDRWESGIGSSIKSGLRHLVNHAQVKAVIVMVCDQPLLQAAHLKEMVAMHISTKAPVVASQYADTLGVPALFDKTVFKELLDLNDSDGAKKIILRHKNLSIPFPEGSIDLDNIDDYHHFIKTHKSVT